MATWKKIVFSLALVAFIGLGSSCNRAGCPAQDSADVNQSDYLQKSLSKKKKKASSSLFPSDFGGTSKKKKRRN